jgi:hypothetical protein
MLCFHQLLSWLFITEAEIHTGKDVLVNPYEQGLAGKDVLENPYGKRRTSKDILGDNRLTT